MESWVTLLLTVVLLSVGKCCPHPSGSMSLREFSSFRLAFDEHIFKYITQCKETFELIMFINYHKAMHS